MDSKLIRSHPLMRSVSTPVIKWLLSKEARLEALKLIRQHTDMDFKVSTTWLLPHVVGLHQSWVLRKADGVACITASGNS